jgi:integrase
VFLLISSIILGKSIRRTFAHPRVVEGRYAAHSHSCGRAYSCCRAGRDGNGYLQQARHVFRIGIATRTRSRRSDVQIKRRLNGKAPKTVNNILATLNRMLNVAVEWGVIESLPCTIKHLRVPRSTMAFHDFAEYQRLVKAASEIDGNTYLIVLLGGEAGLRCGEMMALAGSDVDFERECLVVERSEWKGHVTVPKGGRCRRLPLTVRLQDALQRHRHLRSRRVLCERSGVPFTQKMVRNRVRWAERRAGLRPKGVHVLRHTFCSHLAMHGAAAKAIQELAGHEDLSTTQRYIHLSPKAVESAIRLLDGPVPA